MSKPNHSLQRLGLNPVYVSVKVSCHSSKVQMKHLGYVVQRNKPDK